MAPPDRHAACFALLSTLFHQGCSGVYMFTAMPLDLFRAVQAHSHCRLFAAVGVTDWGCVQTSDTNPKCQSQQRASSVILVSIVQMPLPRTVTPALLADTVSTPAHSEQAPSWHELSPDCNSVSPFRSVACSKGQQGEVRQCTLPACATMHAYTTPAIHSVCQT